ncbi:hypothetical protein JHK86_037983 [Glycine max]|nr:hypothetical protein JHK86_037983 [Glycine max]
MNVFSGCVNVCYVLFFPHYSVYSRRCDTVQLSNGIIRVGLEKNKFDQRKTLKRNIDSEEATLREARPFGGYENSDDTSIIRLKNYMNAQYFGGDWLLAICTQDTSQANLALRIKMAQSLILGSSAEIRYGTGQISGFFSQDYVKVGDLIVLTRILLKQLESISVGKVSPIWYNMLNQHLLAQPGEHTYVPVTHKGYWQTEIGDVLIDRKTTEFCASKCSAIDDSGTSLLAGPTSVVDKTIEKTSYSWNDAGCTACEMAVLCDMLPSPNGESVVECSTLSEMPNVSFTIGGKVLELSPEQE